MNKKCIWITWETQRRNRSISKAINCKLYELNYDKYNAIFRYAASLIKTLLIILKEKPDVVIVQNPSILLALMAVVSKHLLSYKCIVDAHNAGLFPFENKYTLLNYVSKKIQILADMVIVTNDALVDVVNSNGGKAINLPDKLPSCPDKVEHVEMKGEMNLLFVCTFSDDEPYRELVEAAKLIPNDMFIYVTGKYKGKINEQEMPPNLKLLGFVADNKYWDYLATADGVIVLTTRENCLTCGAYEAVSLGKPMILSNTKAIKKYFNSGAIYCDATADGIYSALLKFKANVNILKPEVNNLKYLLENDWEEKYLGLKHVINKW